MIGNMTKIHLRPHDVIKTTQVRFQSIIKKMHEK